MSNLSLLASLKPAQLRQAAVIQEQIEALNIELANFLNGSLLRAPQAATEPESDAEPVKTRKKYKLSAAGRAAKIAALKARFAKVKVKPAAKSEVKPGKKGGMSAAGKVRIIAAQKLRWAKVKAAKTAEPAHTEAKPVKKRRKMSAEGRAKIAAAAKARWARVKAVKFGK